MQVPKEPAVKSNGRPGMKKVERRVGTRSPEMTDRTSEWGQVDAIVTERKCYLGGKICRPSQFDSCGMQVKMRSQGRMFPGFLHG